MKRALAYSAAVVMLLTASGCGNNNEHSDYVSMTSSSSEFEGTDFRDVVQELQAVGFTDVKAEPLGDLITGFLKHPDDVDSVEVNGDSTFTDDDSFPRDVSIVISYHSFPEDEETTETPTPEMSVSEDDGGGTESPIPQTSASETEEILTVDNNSDLAALIAGPDSGATVTDFSEKYGVRTIAFDGEVAAIGADSESSINVLILASTAKHPTGPNFQITGDPTYEGSNIPEDIAVGQKVRVTALVGVYDEIQQLFHLVPVTIQAR